MNNENKTLSPSFNQEIAQELLSIMEKEEENKAHSQMMQYKTTKYRLIVEIKSILVARFFLEVTKFLNPISLPMLFYQYNAIKSAYPKTSTAILKFLNPSILISHLFYEGIKFPLNDQLNSYLKLKYAENICINPFQRTVIDYSSGGLAACISQPIKILYNAIFYQPIYFEQQESYLTQLKKRLSFDSKFIRYFATFSPSKIGFSFFYLGTYNYTNSKLPQKKSTFLQISQSVISSFIAQVANSPLEKTTFMLLRSQASDVKVTFSYCATYIAKYYKENPLKLFDIGGQQLYRLVFNSLLLFSYGKLKTHFSGGYY